MWARARWGGGSGALVRVETWSGLVVVGFGKSLAMEKQLEVELEHAADGDGEVPRLTTSGVPSLTGGPGS